LPYWAQKNPIRYINSYVIVYQLFCILVWLNYDLYFKNCVSSSFCACGFSKETTAHFFFDCDRYAAIRNTLHAPLCYFLTRCKMVLVRVLFLGRYLVYRGGTFSTLSLPKGRALVFNLWHHRNQSNIMSGCVPGGGGMVTPGIDSCISPGPGY
jgi:hypothetical protein